MPEKQTNLDTAASISSPPPKNTPNEAELPMATWRAATNAASNGALALAEMRALAKRVTEIEKRDDAQDTRIDGLDARVSTLELEKDAGVNAAMNRETHHIAKPEPRHDSSEPPRKPMTTHDSLRALDEKQDAQTTMLAQVVKGVQKSPMLTTATATLGTAFGYVLVAIVWAVSNSAQGCLARHLPVPAPIATPATSASSSPPPSR